MKYMRAAIIVLLFILPLYVPAAQAETVQVLTPGEFIRGATVSNPDIFSELEKLKQSTALEDQARVIDDIILSVSYRRLYDQPYQEYSPFRIRTDTTDGASADASWTFPSAGTRMRTGVSYGRRDLDLEERSFIPPYPMNGRSLTVYGPDLFIEVQQPLLRNWLGIIDRYPLRQAGLSRLVMSYTVDEAVETVHADLYSLYTRWYLAWHNCRIFAEHVKNSRELLRQITDRRDRGLADSSDHARASLMVLGYEKGLEQHTVLYRNLTGRILRWYLGSRDTGSYTGIVPSEEMSFNAIPAGFSVDSTRQMKILSLTGKIITARLERDRSSMLPELNAIFSYHLRNYDESKGKSLGAFDYNTYTAGLSLTYPLGNSLAEGQVKESEAKIRQWGHDVESFTRSYERSVQDVRALLESQEKVLATDAELVRHAMVQVQSQEKKYREGRVDLYFLIQARNDLLGYELALLTDTARRRDLTVQLLGLMDILISCR